MKLTVKQKKLVKEYSKKLITESKDCGLMVFGRTTIDNNRIKDFLDKNDYHAEWNAKEGYWLFPEEEDLYDVLEADLDKEFGKLGIDARFEGIFESKQIKNKKISLKKLYESGQLSPDHFPEAGIDKKSFMESLKRFSQYGQSIYGSKKLKEIVNEIKNLIETAEQMTLQETDQWFDNVTVSRHMKQLKESYKLFEKTATEMTTLQQRLESCYEDIGKNLNNYWDVE